MSKSVLSYIVFSVFLLTGCNKTSDLEINECLDSRFTTYEIDKQECIYFEMYEYQSELWTVWHCCVCDYIPMAVNCEGEQLCEFTEDCMNDFFKDAKFLFYFIAEI